MPTDEMERILQHFSAELVKNDRADYEPASFRVMTVSLDRNLREHGATYSILKVKQAAKFRNERQVNMEKENRK